MTTYTLTPNAADPVTKLANPLLGWHFTGATFADVYEGMEVVRATGWLPIIEADPLDDTNTLWRMQLTKGGFPALIIHDTDWFVTDGTYCRLLSQETVTSDYTVTAVSGS